MDVVEMVLFRLRSTSDCAGDHAQGGRAVGLSGKDAQPDFLRSRPIPIGLVATLSEIEPLDSADAVLMPRWVISADRADLGAGRRRDFQYQRRYGGRRDCRGPQSRPFAAADRCRQCEKTRKAKVLTANHRSSRSAK